MVGAARVWRRNTGHNNGALTSPVAAELLAKPCSAITRSAIGEGISSSFPDDDAAVFSRKNVRSVRIAPVKLGNTDAAGVLLRRQCVPCTR